MRQVLWLAALAIILAAGAIAMAVRWTLPDVTGRLVVPDGLRQAVEITRDEHGIPHIRARTWQDAWFALGFVHAQDRLWQMDMMRRTGAGRLAEVLGADLVKTDKFFRTLDLYRDAVASQKVFSTEASEALGSYAAGVNFQLSTARHVVPEFVLLGYRPDPWSPPDSLVWGKLMSLILATDFRYELAAARLAQRLPAAQAALLARLPVSVMSAERHDLRAWRHELDRWSKAFPLPSPPPSASNIWAVSSAASGSRHALLANDPHLTLQLPNSWYLVRMDVAGEQLVGATAPGVPAVVIGHNGRVAWGVTNATTDTQDLFVEKTDPNDPARYQIGSATVPFEIRTETIAVKAREPLRLSVRRSIHGPIISDLADDADTDQQFSLALAFSHGGDTDRSIEGFLRMPSARTIDDVVENLRLLTTSVNAGVADARGSVGLKTTGLIPARDGSVASLPRPGWNRCCEWTGTLAYDALPWRGSPDDDTVVNANDNPAHPGFAHFLGNRFATDARARRIHDVLSEGTPSVESSARLQLDVLSLPARDILRKLMAAIDVNRVRNDWLAVLAGWDARMTRDSREALIFNVWLWSLHQRVAVELGDLDDAVIKPNLAMVSAMLDDDPTICRGALFADCLRLIDLAADDARVLIAERLGDGSTDQSWGRLHHLRLNHPLFGRLPVIGSLTDRGGPVDGGDFTVNRAMLAWGASDDPFVTTVATSLRAVFDLGDLDQSRFVIPGGQSGNPLDSRYDDLLDLWEVGGTVTIPPLPPDPENSVTLAPQP